MYWYIEVLRKYTVFTGRARRSEYWYFILFNFLNSFILSLTDITFGMYDEVSGYGVLSTIYGLAVLVPGIAVAIRRMHDVGKSGWFMLIPIYNIILAITPGIIGDNEYGPDPKDLDQKTSNNLVE